jgi:hypothetical protein
MRANEFTAESSDIEYNGLTLRVLNSEEDGEVIITAHAPGGRESR